MAQPVTAPSALSRVDVMDRRIGEARPLAPSELCGPNGNWALAMAIQMGCAADHVVNPMPHVRVPVVTTLGSRLAAPQLRLGIEAMRPRRLRRRKPDSVSACLPGLPWLAEAGRTCSEIGSWRGSRITTIRIRRRVLYRIRPSRQRKRPSFSREPLASAFRTTRISAFSRDPWGRAFEPWQTIPSALP